jgi:hypothetical protein
MKTKHLVMATAIICFVVTGVSLAWFFMFVSQSPINTVALCFFLFAVFACSAGTVKVISQNVKYEGILVSVGVCVTLALYLLLVIISVFAVPLFRGNVKAYVFAELVLLAVTTLSIVVFSSFGRSIKTENDETLLKLENGELNTPKRGGL